MGDPFIDIYISERTERFRIPVERYPRLKKEEFETSVHVGSAMTLTVEKKQLEKPLVPKDQVSTVFVYQVASGGKAFITD